MTRPSLCLWALLSIVGAPRPALAQQASPTPVDVTWSTDMAEARRLAKERGVQILLYLKDDDEPSAACEAFENGLMRDEQFGAWLRDYVPLRCTHRQLRRYASQLQRGDGMQLAILDQYGAVLARLDDAEPADLGTVRALTARAAQFVELRNRSLDGDPVARLEHAMAELDLRNITPEIAYRTLESVGADVDAVLRERAREQIARIMHRRGLAHLDREVAAGGSRDELLRRLALRLFRTGLVPADARAELLSAAADGAAAIPDLELFDRVVADFAVSVSPEHESRRRELRALRERLAAAPTMNPAARIERALPELRRLVREGITTNKPSTNLLQTVDAETVFDGSYDWHSCIAAHWAGLSMGRVLGDAELVDFLLQRLTPEVLDRERMNLARDDAGRFADMREFFTPYVDAWMLMLLTELVQHDGRDTEQLRAFRSDCIDRVLTALEHRPFPELEASERRPEAAFSGAYPSWLFGFLVLRMCGTADDAQAARLEQLANDKLAPHRDALAAGPPAQPSDFLDLRAVLALIDRLEGRGVSPQQLAPQQLPPWTSLGEVHDLGVIYSRLWPLGFDAATDTAARTHYEARLDAVLRRPDLWCEDFTVITHWIPQYLWMGIWLSRGRP